MTQAWRDNPKYDIMDTAPEAMRAWIRNDLFYLCQILFKDFHIEPHREMCDFLEDPGTPIKASDYRKDPTQFNIADSCKLLVGARGWLKSSCKQAWMVQLGLQNPDIRVLGIMGNKDNAKFDTGMVRQLFDDPILRQLFPDIIPHESERRKWEWGKEGFCLKRKGNFPEPTYTPAGIGTNLTGRHFNIRIPDDIVVSKIHYMGGEEIQPSPKDVENAKGWHQAQLSGLAEPQPIHRGDPKILYPPAVRSLNNRWSPDDYVNFIEENCPEYDMAVFPVRWPDDHPDENRRGKPSWPTGARGNEEALKRIESSMSTYIWNYQYLCNPVDPAQQTFRREYVHFFTKEPKKIVKTIGLVDWGLSTDRSACYTGMVIVSEDENGFWYVMDAQRGQWDTQQQKDTFFSLAEQWKPEIFACEDQLFQVKMLDVLKGDERYSSLSDWGTAIFGVHGSTAAEAKIKRIEALQPRFINKTLLIRPSQHELHNELLRFRRNSNTSRDLLDALSHAPHFLHGEASTSLQEREDRADELLFEHVEAMILSQDESEGMFDRSFGQLSSSKEDGFSFSLTN